MHNLYKIFIIRYQAFQMSLLGSQGCARSFRHHNELLFIAFLVFQFSVALGQEPIQYGFANPIIFQYGFENLWGQDSIQVPGDPTAQIMNILPENLTSIGDFQLGGNLSWHPGAGSHNVSGKWLYRTPVQLSRSCSSQPIVTSFSTLFQFSITLESGFNSSNFDPGAVEGLAFIIGSDNSTQGEADPSYLGWLNSTTDGQASTPHNFAVEIDFHQDEQFHDPSEVHVGVNKNSLTSVNTSSLTVSWLRGQLSGTGQICATIWIEYNGPNQVLGVFGTGTGGAGCRRSTIYPTKFSKPNTPIILTNLDLTDTISGSMFVGFSGSISNSVNRSYGIQYSIDGWTFNSDGPAPDLFRNPDGTVVNPATEAADRRRKTIMIILLTTIPSLVLVSFLVLMICLLYRRNARLTAIAKKYEIEINILEQGPQTFKYKELSTATKKFNSSELLGTGGFGSVYRGRLLLKGDKNPTEVAVKRISATSKQGAQEFLSEVRIIGRAQHRNLVRLLGWCHERDELLLVYDYMPNGSVDHHLYKIADLGIGESVLTWSRRLKIVSGVAAALTYLHEEWEYRVIHRDVKASNVMLDHEFKARLGDFGLARMSEHNQVPASTRNLAGTHGYLAPELFQTLKATEKTDVYSFGALVLEVATGKRPVLSAEDTNACGGKILLKDWVWDLYRDDALLEAADCRLQNAYDQGEMSTFLKIGLLCSHPNPDERPTMRELINIWKGLSPFPPLPRSKPVPIFGSIHTSGSLLDMIGDADTMEMLSTDFDFSERTRRMLPSIDDSDSLQVPEVVLLEENRSRQYPTLRHRQLSFGHTSLPF